MSGTGENEMGLRKIMDFTRLASMIFLIIHFYYYCYGCFKIWGLTAEIGDRFLQNISGTGFLDSPIKSKLLALAMLVISLVGSKGKKDEKVSVNGIVIYLVTGLLLYFLSIFLLDVRSNLPTIGTSYIAVTCIGFLFILTGGTQFSRYIKLNLGKDIFNELNETFPQEERLLENEHSINLPAQSHAVT